MVCKQCGSPLQEEDRFCPVCGASAAAEEEGVTQNAANVCKKCGNSLPEEAQFCPHCGASVAEGRSSDPNFGQPSQQSMPPYAAPQYGQSVPAQADAPSGGFFALGFFFPLVGLILFLVWRDQLPLRSKSCGKGALVGVIVQFVFGFILGIIVGIAEASQYAGAVLTGLALYL